MSTAKTSYVPKAWASLLQLEEGDTKKPVKAFTKMRADRLVGNQTEKFRKHLITERAKDGTQGVSLLLFIERISEIGEKKGFLSMSDLQKAAELSQIGTKAGSTAFRAIVNKLIIGGFIASDRGKKSKEDGPVDLDLSGFDFDDEEVDADGLTDADVDAIDSVSLES